MSQILGRPGPDWHCHAAPSNVLANYNGAAHNRRDDVTRCGRCFLYCVLEPPQR